MSRSRRTVGALVATAALAPSCGSGGGGDGALFDDFDGPLDDTTWIPSYPWDPDGPTTNEANGNHNWYVPEQVRVTGGLLRLRAERRPLDGMDWVSGMVTTCSVRSFGYGLFEARVKLPVGTALWPAFWVSDPDSWPPEVDIFEAAQPEGRLEEFGTNLWSGPSEDPEQDWRRHTLPDPTGWHVWGLLWEPDRLTWLRDGEVVRVETDRVPGGELCILVNLAVGSSTAPQVFGEPDATTPDGAEMLVDWVRVRPLDDLDGEQLQAGSAS